MLVGLPLSVSCDCGRDSLKANLISSAEVDEAVADAAKANDGTRGRGANGHITNALNEEYKKSAS